MQPTIPLTRTRTASSVGEIANSIQMPQQTSFLVWRGELCVVRRSPYCTVYLPLTLVTFSASTEETADEDSDSFLTQDESGTETTENDRTVESSHTRSSNPSQPSEPSTPFRAEFPTMHLQSHSHAALVAASRGLNIAVTKKGNRHSRVMGHSSPRPPMDAIPSPVSPMPSPLHTAKQS